MKPWSFISMMRRGRDSARSTSRAQFQPPEAGFAKPPRLPRELWGARVRGLWALTSKAPPPKRHDRRRHLCES